MTTRKALMLVGALCMLVSGDLALAQGTAALGGARAAPPAPARPRAERTAAEASVDREQEPGVEIPAWALYESFFQHLANVDSVADEQETLGRPVEAAGWRVLEQNAAGLNVGEGGILKQIAYDCNEELAGDASRSSGARSSILETAIGRLQSALGEESFGKLDHHVRNVFGQSVKLIPTGHVSHSEGAKRIADVTEGILVSTKSTVGPGLQAFAECETKLIGFGTNGYRGAVTYCWLYEDTTPSDVLQSQAYCSTPVKPSNLCKTPTFAVKPGHTYYAEGSHGVALNSSYICSSISSGSPWEDPLGYGYPFGTPLPTYYDSFTILPSRVSHCWSLPAEGVAGLGWTLETNEFTPSLDLTPPPNTQVLPGQKVTIHATASPSAIPQIFTFTIDNSVGSSSFVPSAASAVFTAPKNTELSRQELFTVKACLTATPTWCATTTLVVQQVTGNIVAQQTKMLASAGAFQTFTANVTGTVLSDLTWTLTGSGTLAPDPANPLNPYARRYTVPTPPTGTLIAVPESVGVSVCIPNTAPALCTDGTAEGLGPPLSIRLEPAVNITSVTPNAWPAGSIAQIQIAGSGFTTTPTVVLGGGAIAFVPTPPITNLLIAGTATIPLSMSGKVDVRVDAVNEGVFSTKTLVQGVSILPPTYAVTVSPASAQLYATQTQTFTPTVKCTTADNKPCAASQAVTWSFQPGTTPKGTISAAGVYMAPASVSAQSTDTVRACTQQTTPVCGTATVTLIPINVTVNPTGATVNSCGTASFTASVSAGTLAPPSTVSWSIAPALGSIVPQTGQPQASYQAPCPLTAAGGPVTVNACSTVDGTRCAQASILLLTVTSVTPPVGNMAGGTSVTISGSGFQVQSPPTVAFGSSAATSVTVVSPTQLTAVTPPGSCGSVAVNVTSANKTATLANAYTYAPPPPTGLSPNGTAFPYTTTTVTLTWAPSAGATEYAVRVRDNTDGTLRDPRNNCPGVYLCVNDITSTSYSVPVIPGHSYAWWVHAGGACGKYSAPSTTAAFSVDPIPLHTPSNLSVQLASRNLVWAAPDNATAADQLTYDVTITGPSPCVAGCVYHTTNTWYTMGAEIGPGSYSWTLKANSSVRPSAGAVAGPGFVVPCLNSLAAPPPDPQEFIWVDDQIPAGAIERDVWVWDTAQKASGTRSSTQPSQAGIHQHYFDSSPTPLVIGANDTLVAYVLLDPCDPPQEVMLQWWSPVSGWEHRAFWGPDLIPWGTHVSMGALPATGQWVKLSVPASTVGLAGASVYGMAFTQYGGHMWFDRAGVIRATDDAAFVSQTPPPSCMWPGSTAAVSVTMRNTGNTVWDSLYRLGSQNPQDNGTWGVGRVFLAPGETVAPGQSKTFSFNVTMPSTAGTYNFQWRMVHEGVRWFGGLSPNVSATNAAPAAPTGLSPSGTTFPAGTTSVTLSWNPTTFATKWAVRVRDDTDATLRDPRNNCSGVYLCVNDITSTSYSVPVISGHSYTWWVHAGDCVAYSAQSTTTFTVAAPTPPPPPTGLSPNGVALTVGSTSVTMSWAATPGATNYAVRLQDNTDGSLRSTWNCPGTPTIYLCVNGVVPNSYVSAVVPGHSYTWWVHASNAYGTSAPTYASFSVPVVPLHAPTGLYKEASPSRNLVWTPPDNLTGADAVTYDLRITGGANCAGGCLYHPAAPSWYTMGAEIGPGTYAWTLKANSATRPSSGAVSGPSFTMP